MVPLATRQSASCMADSSGKGEIKPFLAGDGPFLVPEVAAVDLDDPFRGEPAEPGIKRQRPVAEVTLKLVARIGQGLLDHVRGVDQRRQPAYRAGRRPSAATGCGAAPARAWSSGPPLPALPEQFLGLRIFHGLCHDLSRYV